MVVVLAFSTSLAGPLPAEEPPPADAAMLDAYLAEQVASSPLPGLAVAVTRGGEVVLLGGYGRTGNGQAMTADTPLRAASLSKSFTAAAVLRLVESGAIELDAPVRRYLPQLTLADDAAASRITVRHLLNHTSGLADRGFPGLWQLDQRSPGERTASLATAHPVTEPGAAHHYFNPNYEVLAHLVETVSGAEFNDYLTRHVFDPLGMTATTTVTRAEDAPAAAPGLASGHIVAFGRPMPHDEPEGFTAGSGGVVTTARDHARWLSAQLGAGTDHSPVLSADSIALMHTPPDGVDSVYGMGWWTAMSGQHRIVEHNGVLATFYAEQALIPATGHGIVLLANANHAFNDVGRIKHGLVALLTGTAPAPAPVTHLRLVVLFAALLLVGLIVRGHGFASRQAWTRRARTVRWRAGLGVARLLVPAGMLAGLPVVIVLTTGRAFPHGLLLLAAPELVLWMAVASVTGLALAAARLLALRGSSKGARDT